MKSIKVESKTEAKGPFTANMEGPGVSKRLPAIDQIYIQRLKPTGIRANVYLVKQSRKTVVCFQIHKIFQIKIDSYHQGRWIVSYSKKKKGQDHEVHLKIGHYSSSIEKMSQRKAELKKFMNTLKGLWRLVDKNERRPGKQAKTTLMKALRYIPTRPPPPKKKKKKKKEQTWPEKFGGPNKGNLEIFMGANRATGKKRKEKSFDYDSDEAQKRKRRRIETKKDQKSEYPETDSDDVDLDEFYKRNDTSPYRPPRKGSGRSYGGNRSGFRQKSLYEYQPRRSNRLSKNSNIDLTDLDSFFELGEDEMYYGVENLGNTCYMSAILSALRHNGPFLSDLRAMTDFAQRMVGEGNLTLFGGTLFEEFCNLLLSNQEVLKPERLKELLSIKKPDFESKGQQDAHEFILALFDVLKDDVESFLKNINVLQLLRTHGLELECPIVKNFRGIITRKLKCMKCTIENPKDDPFEVLSIDIENRNSVDKTIADLNTLLEDYLQAYQVQRTCSTCGFKGGATTIPKLARLPKYLVVHIKRFKFTYNRAKKRVVQQKIHRRLDIPENIAINKNYIDDTALQIVRNRRQAITPILIASNQTTSENQMSGPRDRDSDIQIIEKNDMKMESPQNRDSDIRIIDNDPKPVGPTPSTQFKRPLPVLPEEGKKQVITLDTTPKPKVEKVVPPKQTITSVRVPGTNQAVEYNLNSFVIHKGSGVQRGHYVALTFDKESQTWNQVNDDVTKKKFANALGVRKHQKTVYILFFELDANSI